MSIKTLADLDLQFVCRVWVGDYFTEITEESAITNTDDTNFLVVKDKKGQYGSFYSHKEADPEAEINLKVNDFYYEEGLLLDKLKNPEFEDYIKHIENMDNLEPVTGYSAPVFGSGQLVNLRVNGEIAQVVKVGYNEKDRWWQYLVSYGSQTAWMSKYALEYNQHVGNRGPVIPVVFRKWKSDKDYGGKNDQSILALFPTITASSVPFYYCSSYEHLGQHSDANYRGCLEATVPATFEEYRDLLEELANYGDNSDWHSCYWNLQICEVKGEK